MMRNMALMLLLAACGCTPNVTISHNIRRALPIVVEEGCTPGKRVEFGAAHRSGDDGGEKTEEYYSEVVNRTFAGWQRSNTLYYLRCSPLQFVSFRAGMDDIGYCGDISLRYQKGPALGYITTGVTLAEHGNNAGYHSYPRVTMGASVAPLAALRDSNDHAALRLGLNVTWTKFPQWIDLTQTYYNHQIQAAASWAVHAVHRGEARMAQAIASWSGRWLVISGGFEHDFHIKEKAVHVNISSQPPIIIDSWPADETRLLLRAGILF